jgi:cytochrome b subunit of formate dehydrogenase
MILHNTIMMSRHALTKFMQEIRNGEKTYRRFSSGLTLGHLILTISFIALTVSGFALRYPETWWARHLFVGETGLALRGVVHRFSALILVGLALANFVYLVGTRGGRKELGHLWLTRKDIKDVFTNLGYALGLVKHAPCFDRYSYIEKFEYWGMWWGTVLMIITGFCMWFVDLFLRYFPKIALDVVALIHFYEAWLAVLTIVVWHLYYMIFDPETYPMNWSWITGHITMDDFKVRHPLEYEREVVKTGRAGKEAMSEQDAPSTLLKPESEADKTDPP